jgi:hypothetical protein
VQVNRTPSPHATSPGAQLRARQTPSTQLVSAPHASPVAKGANPLPSAAHRSTPLGPQRLSPGEHTLPTHSPSAHAVSAAHRSTSHPRPSSRQIRRRPSTSHDRAPGTQTPVAASTAPSGSISLSS